MRPPNNKITKTEKTLSITHSDGPRHIIPNQQATTVSTKTTNSHQKVLEQAQLEHYKALFLYAILTIPLLTKLPPKKWQTFLIIYSYLTCSKYSSAHFVGTL